MCLNSLKILVSFIMTVCLIFPVASIAQNVSVNPLPALTTENAVSPEPSFAVQIMQPGIILSKEMVQKATLAAEGKNHARVELLLTAKATKQLKSISRLKNHQKLVFVINNEVSEAFSIIGNPSQEKHFSLLLEISTSSTNADLIMKTFS